MEPKVTNTLTIKSRIVGCPQLFQGAMVVFERTKEANKEPVETFTLSCNEAKFSRELLEEFLVEVKNIIAKSEEV